jgi:hypothetical protein
VLSDICSRKARVLKYESTYFPIFLDRAILTVEEDDKVTLETVKEKDTDEKVVEELKRQLQPKRALTHDDDGNADEMLGEVENWDLSVQHAGRQHVCKTVGMCKSGHDNQPFQEWDP